MELHSDWKKVGNPRETKLSLPTFRPPGKSGETPSQAVQAFDTERRPPLPQPMVPERSMYLSPAEIRARNERAAREEKEKAGEDARDEVNETETPARSLP